MSVLGVAIFMGCYIGSADFGLGIHSHLHCCSLLRLQYL